MCFQPVGKSPETTVVFYQQALLEVKNSYWPVLNVTEGLSNQSPGFIFVF